MSSFTLKCLAYIFMIIDHCTIAFEWNSGFRCIGRMAFPIFAYLISEGCRYTKDFKEYILRLLICALMSEWIYDTVFKDEINLFFDLNIMFTLALSVLGIYIFENLRKYDFFKIFGCFIILLFIMLAQFFRFDYGFLGVGLIFAFYFLKDKKQQIFALFVFTILKYSSVIWGTIAKEFNILFLRDFVGYVTTHNIYSVIFSFMSAVFIFFYNGKKGFSVKYLFYVLYPMHIFVIYLFSYFR